MNNLEKAKSLSCQAISRIEQAIQNHKDGKSEDLSISLLEKVKVDLEKVKRSNFKEKLSYGRFVSDWPNENGLVDFLIEVAYQISRCK